MPGLHNVPWPNDCRADGIALPPNGYIGNINNNRALLRLVMSSPVSLSRNSWCCIGNDNNDKRYRRQLVPVAAQVNSKHPLNQAPTCSSSWALTENQGSPKQTKVDMSPCRFCIPGDLSLRL